jgi:hypothetical protein
MYAGAIPGGVCGEEGGGGGVQGSPVEALQQLLQEALVVLGGFGAILALTAGQASMHGERAA